jgi:hypothetical protein
MKKLYKERSRISQLTSLAWCSGMEGGKELFELYKAGRVAYEVYQRLTSGSSSQKDQLRAETVKKICEFVESNKRMPKDKLAAEVQKMIAEFAVQVALL